MNNDRRKRIDEATKEFNESLEEIFAKYRAVLEEVKEEEEEAYDNLPEAIVYTVKGHIMEECIDAIDNVLEGLDVDSVLDQLEIEDLYNTCGL